jgi:hypothetical protein
MFIIILFSSNISKDDDNSTDQQLNVSAISRRTHSPSPLSTTLIDDSPVDKEEQFVREYSHF